MPHLGSEQNRASLVPQAENASDSRSEPPVAELQTRGAMVRVGVHRKTRAILWRPGSTLLAVLGSEEALVDALAAAFDATEGPRR